MVRVLLQLSSVRHVLWIGAAALAWACSEPTQVVSDADLDTGSDSDTDAQTFELVIEEPAPPTLPELPVLTPCLAGWREVASETENAVTFCEPWPEGGYIECTGDEAHFPGESSCTRIGTACNDAEWPQGLPGDREVLYVRAGGGEGGDGTQGSPFGTIGEAMSAAEPTMVIALSKGRYEEPVELQGGVTLWGACVAETTVVVIDDPETNTIEVTGAEAEVRNLRVGGSRYGISADGEDRSVRLEGVLVDSATRVGLIAKNMGRITGREVVVRDMLVGAEATEACGLIARLSGTIELERVLIERSTYSAVVSQEEAVVTLTTAAIMSSRADANDFGGRGVEVKSGASCELRGVVVENNQEIGIALWQEDTTITIDDVVVRGTRARVDGDGGVGLFIQDGPEVVANRMLVVGNRDAAVAVLYEGSSLTMEDAIIRDTEERAVATQDPRGEGLRVYQGAEVEITRALIEGNRQVGVQVVGYDGGVTSATLRDLVVRDTELNAHGLEGNGLRVIDGAVVDVSRALFERNHRFGVRVVGSQGREPNVTLTDVTIRDTLGDAMALWGIGLEVAMGATVTLSRAVLEQNRTHGIHVDEACLTMTDVVVRDAVGDIFGWWGRGLEATYGATVEGSRVRFERNREASIIAFREGTEMTFEHVVVSETHETVCGETTCIGRGGGTGVMAMDGTHIELTQFLVTRNALAGVLVGLGGEMDLSYGEISSNPIGASVHDSSFDVERLMDHVIYKDNDRNLDTTELPIPEMGDPMDLRDE